MAGLKTIFRTLTTDVGFGDIEGVGVLRYENDRTYRWVTNPTTNYTPAAGDLVVHSFGDGVTAVQNIYKPATANLAFLAGVICSKNMGANTGSNPYIYGWIQVFGEITTGDPNVVNVTTTATAGSSLKAANGVTYAVTDQAAGTAPSYIRTIELIDSPATTTTTAVNVFVRCF